MYPAGKSWQGGQGGEQGGLGDAGWAEIGTRRGGLMATRAGLRAAKEPRAGFAEDQVDSAGKAGSSGGRWRGGQRWGDVGAGGITIFIHALAFCFLITC